MILSILNGCTIPIDIAFQLEIFQNPVFMFCNYIIDIIFVVDVYLAFKTSYINPCSGEEVTNGRKIAINYLFSIQFILDILSAMSLDTVVGLFTANDRFSNQFKLLQMFKFFRLLRLSRFINAMNQSEDVKLSLKLFKLCLFLLLYIHCSACFLFFVATVQKSWKPGQVSYYGNEVDFFDLDFFNQYTLAFYNALLAMLGNEIYPTSLLMFWYANFALLLGALINANIFGTIVVIVQTFNRRQQILQDRMDVANTSMKNMKLPEELQNSVREFMMTTQNNLDNQKEMDQFLTMISPSLRMEVTQCIFLEAIGKNSIFKGQDIIDFLVKDISLLLFLPEDSII